MGIILENNNERSKLQERINADLRERTRRSSVTADTDFVDKSEYTSSLKKTSRFAWVWFVLITLAVLSVIVILAI